MTLVGLLRKWLVATPIAGKLAFTLAVTAVALPTLYRVSLSGMLLSLVGSELDLLRIRVGHEGEISVGESGIDLPGQAGRERRP